MQDFIQANKELMFTTLKELCLIPAPSHKEHKRAEYCKKWLESIGAKGVYIDEALNVIFPLHCENSNEMTVFASHTDTVFPDTEPMPYLDDGVRVHCPGAADDTASVVVLLAMAKYFIEKSIVPPKGILFVCNTCEEGLGNLKGTRQLFKNFEGRIAQFITFDSLLHVINDHCVGSHRYEVEVLTKGGHSFGDFGNENAIAILAGIIQQIYAIEIPQKSGTRTTYNVGTITGGTSVNTIAQSAKMLCEYRSDDKDCLAYMQKQFESIFHSAQAETVQLTIKKVGDRPCSCTDSKAIDALKKIIAPIVEAVIQKPVIYRSSSTDCNIPLSLGIPALCIGVNAYAGMHTREEWVDKESLLTGLEIAIKTGLALANMS